MKLNLLHISHKFRAAAYFCFMVFVNCETKIEENNSKHETKVPQEAIDHHTFVALVDIVFTDGSKKTCTGSIIHDNVVITAAHCFVRENLHSHTHHTSSFSQRKKKPPSIHPELTTSFIVIGTKKMFQSGYEQYLPIERIATHPKFRGWTADLTLVFTFATMTSDKPGTIIPLARDNSFAPVDSNLTVFSWGHVLMELPEPMFTTALVNKNPENGCSESKENEPSLFESIKPSFSEALRKGSNPESISNEKDQIKDDGNQAQINENIEELIQKEAEKERKQQNQKHQNQMLRKRFRKQLQTNKQLDAKEYIEKAFSKTSTKIQSRYLMDSDEDEKDEGPLIRHIDTTDYKNRKNRHAKKTTNKNRVKIYHHSADHHTNYSNTHAKKTTKKRLNTQQSEFQPYKLNYKNWRRQMGSQQNVLTVDSFTFINVQMCKKMVDKSMPAIYGIKDGNEIVCYSSERRFITIDDSGAPVVQQGHLVAVTVGGVTIDDEHVAVGMKISCFCSWIAANLPGGGKHLQCCQNCCDLSHKRNFNHKNYN